MASKQKAVFVLMPFRSDFDRVFPAVEQACLRASVLTGLKIQCGRGRNLKCGGHPAVFETIKERIQRSDAIVADISENNPNVLWEVGFSESQKKPIVLLSSTPQEIPAALLGSQLIVYEPEILDGLTPRLADSIVEALGVDRVADLQGVNEANPERTQIFISYCHADSASLTRLLVHLRPLESKRFIHLWSDRQIRPGEKWEDKVQDGLRRAKAAVLLISADFLASDYVVNHELPSLLSAAEKEGVRIIPLILKPCGFLRDKRLSCFKAINDPKTPLLKMDEIEQEEILERLSETLEIG